MIIDIKHRLLILGDKVRVPGFEPLSEQTVRSLSIAYQGRDSYVPLCMVLKLIPNAKVIISTLTDGMGGVEKFLELPSGPINGNECVCPEDWYKVIRDAAGERMVMGSPEAPQECAAFETRRCDFTDLSNSLDPAKR